LYAAAEFTEDDAMISAQNIIRGTAKVLDDLHFLNVAPLSG